MAAAALCAAAVLGATGAPLAADAPAKRKAKKSPIAIRQAGSSSRAARNKALKALPFDRLSASDRLRVQNVFRRADIFRELPTLRFPTDRQSYDYFATHPDVSVSIWRALGISKFHLKHIGPRKYEIDTGDGTRGLAEVLYHKDGHLVAACRGQYSSVLLFRPVKAEAVIHLQTVFSQTSDGRTFATHRASLHVDFPSVALGTIARLVSPMSNRIMDHNFVEVSAFLRMMSLAMQKNPGWVEQLAGKLDGIPESRRKSLLKTTARVYIAARKRNTIGLFKSPRERLDDIVRALPVAGSRPRQPATGK